MRTRNLLGYVIVWLIFTCVPYITQGVKLYDEIEQELDNINSGRGAKALSLQQLEILRKEFNSTEEFEGTITPLKPKISQAANKVIDFPMCFCESCYSAKLLLQCRHIDKVFAFLSHWPVHKEDLDQPADRFKSQTKVQVLKRGMRLTLTFPDLLNFNKAREYLPDLNHKFGEEFPFDLSSLPEGQKYLLKAKVRVIDQIIKHNFIGKVLVGAGVWVSSTGIPDYLVDQVIKHHYFIGWALAGAIVYIFYTGERDYNFDLSQRHLF